MTDREFTEAVTETKPEDCLACGGTGSNDPTGEQGPDPRCLTCKGSGKRMPEETNSIDFKIDWKTYPKLAGVFEHRPGVNVYWAELRALLREAREEAYRRGEGDERKAVVTHCRETGDPLKNDNEEGPRTFMGAVVNLGAKLLGHLAGGLGDYFESGAHRKAEPTPRDPLSVTRPGICPPGPTGATGPGPCPTGPTGACTMHDHGDRQGDTDGVGALILRQRELDEETRVMAREIVEAQDPKTLAEAKQFAENWIGTAAQHARNEEYWSKRAREAEKMSAFWREGYLRSCCGCVAKDCPGHGAYDPDETKRLLAARDDDRATVRRRIDSNWRG